MNIQVLKRVNCSCISGIKKNELKKIKEKFLKKAVKGEVLAFT